MLTGLILFSSCSHRVVDFTLISSKSHNLNINKTEGIRVAGKSMKAFGVGTSIKEALDEALESAGAEYDLLIDGVVNFHDYFFVNGYKVEGIAISTSKMRASLGEDGFKDWCNSNNVFDPNTALVENIEEKDVEFFKYN